jgi:hypothetical protein
MNKYDLRVGNLVELLTTGMQVNLQTGKYAEIEEVREDKVKLRYDYETSENSCYFNRKYNTIRAIKITSEVLISLGFTYKEKLDFFIKNWGENGFFIVVKRYDDFYVEMGSHTYIKFESVHKLQNIFYEYTDGKQLKFIKW